MKWMAKGLTNNFDRFDHVLGRQGRRRTVWRRWLWGAVFLLFALFLLVVSR